MLAFKWLDRHTVKAPNLALCLSKAEFLAAAKHIGCDQPGEWMSPGQVACAHSFERRGKLTCLICFDTSREADGIDVAATMVHEAVHVFQRLCDSIGEDGPSREFEAYSIERIAERLMREYARRMGK